MTEDQVRAILQRAVDEAGGQRAFSRKHKVSAAQVGLVLAGETPGPKILKPLGIEAKTVTTYRKIKR
jgi:hypothetical protein